MKKVASREDKAVSPIIATVLLVGITVTMIATAYTLLENYIPSPAPSTPSAALKIVYKAGTSGGNYYGNYTVYINSLNGNVSVRDVELIVTLSNNSVDELSLQQVYASANSLDYGNYLTASLQSDSGFLTSTSFVGLYLHNSSSSITRIAIVDTLTGGSIGSSPIS